MAFDISIGGEAPPEVAVTFSDFEEFYEANAEIVGRALYLVAPDDDAAASALRFAFVRSSQQWSRIRSAPNPVGWTFGQGLDHIQTLVDERPSEFMNEATGGYVRGLSLVDAMRILPVQQRGALVAAQHLGWSDSFVAEGMRVPVRTVERRRVRAEDFVHHHLQNEDNPQAVVAGYFVDRMAHVLVVVPAVVDIRRRARRLNLRSRLLIGLGALAAIAVIGLLFNLNARETVTVDGPDEVIAPGTSADWLGPVSDGQGGFVALNTAGSSRFSVSDDGGTWFSEANWNSRAVDLRSEVTGFVRTGDRYVATIEAAPAISASLTPFIASSRNLEDWNVRPLEIGPFDEIEGIRTRADVLSVAAAGQRVLVAVGTADSIDYQQLDVLRSDVCAEASFATQLTLHLCDGTTRSVNRPAAIGDTAPESAKLYLSEGSGDFVEVLMPTGADPYGLVSFADGFALVHGTTGEVLVSQDGRLWTPGFAPDQANRLVLIEGSAGGEALAVVPQAGGWIAAPIKLGEQADSISLPITIDPASVWIKPELASGPAGWALFVSTSRPWERTDISRGWAVDTGDWIASRQPDSRIITLRSGDGSTTYRYIESDTLAVRGIDERVTLFDPATGVLLVDISQAMIDDSRAGAISLDAGIEAEVFFSPNGESWRSIWQSSDDSWFGSLAVGDNEVLLSGTQLVGAPISIPIGE